MKIINTSSNTLLAENASIAESLFSRIKGLLGRSSLGANEALIIKSCNSIHTFFMRFAIDVIFLDRDNRVVGLKENMPPFRVTPIYYRAIQVVELPAYTISRTKTQLNDRIQLENQTKLP